MGLKPALSCPSHDVRFWGIGQDILGRCVDEDTGHEQTFYLPAGKPATSGDALLGDLPSGKGVISSIEGTDLQSLVVELTVYGTGSGIVTTLQRSKRGWKTLGSYGWESYGGDRPAPAAYVEIGHRMLADDKYERSSFDLGYQDRKPGWLPKRGSAPGCNEQLVPYIELAVAGPDLWGFAQACGQVFMQRWTIGGSSTEIFPTGIKALVSNPYTRLLALSAGRWLFGGSVSGDEPGPPAIGILATKERRFTQLKVPPEVACKWARPEEAVPIGDRDFVTYCNSLLESDGDKLVAIASPFDPDTFFTIAAAEGRLLAMGNVAKTAHTVVTLDEKRVFHPISTELPPEIAELSLGGVAGRTAIGVYDPPRTTIYVTGGAGAPLELSGKP